MGVQEYPKTKLNRVVRHPERASYTLDDVKEIFSECLTMSLSYMIEDGYPAQQTMIGVMAQYDESEPYAMYLHGYVSGRFMRAAKNPIKVSVGCSILDGIVLAYAPFNHT